MSGTTSSNPTKGLILVVEDDDATLRFLTTALERGGFAVTGVTEASAASSLLETENWDVLLADIGLPGTSGFELIQDARARRPDMATALMTADASVDVAVRALRSEVDDFLPKPIAPATLVTQIERLVERRRTRRSDVVQRVLAIGAHPDDVEVGVGGILLGHRGASDAVAILTLSHGARGGDQDRRAREATQSAELLGARLFLESLEDTRIPESDPTVSMIEEIIEEIKPTIIYTHSVSDLHQDHRNVHHASMVAGRRVPSVYCYQSPSATVEFQPARFVGIDDHIDRKLEVIGAYASQTESRSYLEEDLVRATARYWGRFGATRFCEPLEVIRDRPDASLQPSSAAARVRG